MRTTVAQRRNSTESETEVMRRPISRDSSEILNYGTTFEQEEITKIVGMIITSINPNKY